MDNKKVLRFTVNIDEDTLQFMRKYQDRFFKEKGFKMRNNDFVNLALHEFKKQNDYVKN